MTRGRLTALILGAFAVLAIAAWAVTSPGSNDSSPAGAAVAPAPTPTDSTWPLLDVAPSAGPVSSAPAAPSTTAAAPAVAAPSPSQSSDGEGAGETPAPFVQTFAANPGVRPQKPLPSPTKTLSIPANVDGCDHGYGTRTQCIPWTFPAGTTDKCAWLASHGFKDIAVLAADRHKLDPDRNGIACDA